MRDVLDAIDGLGVPRFVTGSVAASVYGVLRASQDVDVVLDMDASGFRALDDAGWPAPARQPTLRSSASRVGRRPIDRRHPLPPGLVPPG